MSLVSYGEIHRDGTQTADGHYHYVQIYRVVLNSERKASPGDVAAEVPGSRWITSWEDNVLARLKDKSAKQVATDEDGGEVWEVTCLYDSQPMDLGQSGTDGAVPSGDPGQGSATTRPDLRPVVWDLDSTEVQFYRDEDYTAPTPKKFVASNSQPFNPPLQLTGHHPLITVTKFKPLNTDTLANTLTYTGRVNSNSWWVFGAKQLLCRKYKLTSLYEHNSWWWQKTLVLEGKEDYWNPTKFLDAGTYERHSSLDPDHAFRPILGPNGAPVSDPVPLDGTGHKLAPGLPLVYLEFNLYKEVSFTSIL